MNNRTLYILFSIFVILIVASVWPRIQIYIRGSQTTEGLWFSGFTAESVSRVTIVGADKEILLTKKDGGWQIGDFAASDTVMESFFADLSKLTVGELAAVKAESQVQLGVVEGEGTQLSLLRDDRGREDTFVFGESTGNSDGLYVRRADSDDVYSVRGSLGVYLANSINDWRDKTILKVSSDDLAKIEVVEGAVVTVVTKKDKDWEATRQGRTVTLSALQANALNTSFNPLTAVSFLNEQEVRGFRAGQSASIRLLAIDGTVLQELSVALQGDGEVWVEAAGNSENVIYELSAYQLAGLAEPANFFEKEEGGNE